MAIMMVMASVDETAFAANQSLSGTKTSTNSPIISNVYSTSSDGLRKLMDGHQLTEMRTTYNGTYGASLMFQSDYLYYYVALFHGKDFLRVMQSDSYDAANSVYRSFVSQTEALAEVELDDIRLQAGKKRADELVVLNEQRLQKLQGDASYQRQQAEQVAVSQEKTKQQAAELATNLHATDSQLDGIKRSIRDLEAQQTNPALVLPSVNRAQGAPAPSSSSP